MRRDKTFKPLKVTFQASRSTIVYLQEQNNFQGM